MNKIFKETDTINLKWDIIKYYLEKETLAIVILSQLYENKKITYEKLKGQIQSLRKGELTKHRNLFHCSINDRWYKDESFTEIYGELYTNENISYLKLIEVIQLFSGKNYNYAINYLVSNIFKPFLNYFSNTSYDYFSYLLPTNLRSFPNIEQKGYSTSCYECGHKHFESDYRRTMEQINDINDFFHDYKKGNLSKIPKLII